MSRDDTILCDQCKTDITYTPYESQYRIKLYCEPMNHKGGIVYATAWLPPIRIPRDFCGTTCLMQWLNATFLENTSPESKSQSVEK